MEVQKVLIGEIKVKDRAREDKGEIEKLAESIKTHGLMHPIILNMQKHVVAGERRYLAHRLLGFDDIDAVVLDTDEVTDLELELVENIMRKDLTWTERSKLELRIWNARVKQYGVYEASLNPKGWSQHKQARLVGRDQAAVLRSLEIATTMEEVPELELENNKTEDDAWKDVSKLKEKVILQAARDKLPAHVKNAVTKAADHYIIGDALQEMAKMDKEVFNFAEVDPPYGVDLEKRKSRNTDDRPMDEYQEWDDISYPELFEKTAKLVYDRLKHNSFAIFWYGMSWHCKVLPILRSVGFGVPDIPAIWTKGEAGQTASPFTTLGSCYEPFFLVRKDLPKLPRQGRGNIFNYPMVQKKDHPTEKPLVLMEEILNLCLDPGSHILIPFLGSGVTLRAAYRLKHTGMGWDLSQAHKDSFLNKIAADMERRE